MKYKHIIIPCILLLCSFILRLLLISKGPFSIDCFDLALKAEKTYSSGQLQYMFGPGYPFAIILGAMFIWLFNAFNISSPIFAVNMMSVVTGSLAVFFFYRISESITDQKSAIFGTVLFSLNPIVLGYSVYGTSNAPTLLWLCVSVYFLIISRENKDSLKNLLLSAVFFGLLGGTRLQDMIFLSIPIASLLFISKKAYRIRRIFVFFLTAVSVSILFYLPFVLTDMRIEYLSQLTRFRALNVPTYSWDFTKESFFKIHIYLLNALLPIGLITSLYGLFILVRNKNPFTLFLLLWFFIPFEITIRFATTYSRYLLIPIVPLSIAAGACLSYLFSKGRIFKMASILILCRIFYFSFLPMYKLLDFRHHRSVIIEYCKWINGITEKNAFMISCDDRSFINHYGDREIISRPMDSFHISREQLEEFKTRLDEKLEEGYPVYITAIGLYDYSPNGEFTSFMELHYRIKYAGKGLYEDWHSGAEDRRIFYNSLYKVTKK